MFFCFHCGEKSASEEEFDCGCETLLNSKRILVTDFEISAELKENVCGRLSALSMLDSFENNYSTLIGAINCVGSARCGLASEEVTDALFKEVRSAAMNPEKNMNNERRWDFVKRPFSLAASCMTKEEHFKECFSLHADLVQLNNPESKYIDILFGDHFNYLNPGRLQLNVALQLPSDLYAPIYALPDAIWTFNGVEYVIEVKTIRRFDSMIKHGKLSEWLRQVGCSQLPSLESVIAFNNDSTPLPTDHRRYLLLVIVLENYKSFLLEVKPANISACRVQWLKWFNNRVESQKSSRDIKDLMRYHVLAGGTASVARIPFAEIKWVKAENEKLVLLAQDAADGWEHQGRRKKGSKKG